MALKLTFLLFIFLNLNTQAQGFFSDQFPKIWERSMDYSLAVAQAMPEDAYAYKPDSLAMSFKEQWLHIADNITFLTEMITGEKKVFYDKALAEKMDKAQVISVLSKANFRVLDLIKNTSVENLNRSIIFRNETMTIENIFYLIRNHQVHHRGQCLVYLRLNKVKAPPYVGW